MNPIQPITITIPADLLGPLVSLVDAGVRAVGIKAAAPAAIFVQLIDQAHAQQAAAAPGNVVPITKDAAA